VSQVVSEAELPSAAILNGLQFNISGTISPLLGGLLIPFAGANLVFALNAACFLLIVLATRQWRQPTMLAKPCLHPDFTPPESEAESCRANDGSSGVDRQSFTHERMRVPMRRRYRMAR